MSKIHQKTGYVCLVCDEKIEEENTVHLHKTRRQSHNMCTECAVGYFQPLLDDITNNLRRNIRRDMQFVPCPGAYHSVLSNRCKHTIDVTNILVKDLEMLL